MSLNIKFPEEHYLGLIVSRESDDLPLGFLTPEGTDKQAMNRKGTVDNWVSSNSWHYDNATRQRTSTAIPTRTLKNEPLAGFRLLHSVQHGGRWGAGNIKWRLEDPRGFELEITSSNLMEIMACTTIENAEIQDLCMWAREGSENILVPVTSEVYKTAMVNTARSKKSASMTDLKMGDTVIMQNGKSGIYYGKMNIVEYKRDNIVNDYLVIGKPRFLLVNHEDKVIHANASMKLAEIIDGDPISPEEAEKFIAEKTKNGRWGTDIYRIEGGNTYGVRGFTFSKTIKTSHKIEQLDWDNIPHGGYVSAVFKLGDKVCVFSPTRYKHTDDVDYYEIKPGPWYDGYEIDKILSRSPHSFSYSRHQGYPVAIKGKYSVLKTYVSHVPYMEVITDFNTVIKVYAR